jgi:putative intracellular protease/amidase
MKKWCYRRILKMSGKRKIVFIGSIIVLLMAIILIALPSILRWMGLHPNYTRTQYDLKDKKALIITTSHDTLGDTGKKTGVFASEMTVPYYEFLDAGMTVDMASIQGGAIPIDNMSMKWPFSTAADKRFLKDNAYQDKVRNSMKVADVDFSQVDIVYMAGGWGAAYDLGQSAELGRKISEAYARGKILGSVCHGALGFIKAVDEAGKPLVEGKKMTAVTDKQVRELGISITPLHPETELRKLGADFQSNTAFKDFFATCVVIDGNIVTGQNQNSGGDTAQAMLRLLAEKSR